MALILPKEEILEYKNMLNNDIKKFDETCEIIKSQGLECESKNEPPVFKKDDISIGYFIEVSNLWQKTTKEGYEAMKSLNRVIINMEYYDESWELLHNIDIPIKDRIQEIEEYLEE